MRTRASIMAVLFAGICTLGIAGPAICVSGSDGVVSGADLRRAVAGGVSEEDASRARVAAFLERPEVGRVAAKAGLDIGRARALAGTLRGPDLQRVQQQVNLAEGVMAGDTIIISATTLIIILLVIIIVIMIA